MLAESLLLIALLHPSPPRSFPVLNASITIDQAQIVWGKVEEGAMSPHFAPLVDDIVTSPFPTIRLSTGREIWARSTQYRCKYVRGHQFAGIAYDEIAYGSNEDMEVLRMRLADVGGPLLGGTTPRGKNWFYRDVWRPCEQEIEHARAEGARPKSYLVRGTTFDNPHVDHEYIRDNVVPRLTARQVKQEIYGEFVETGDSPWGIDAVDECRDNDLVVLGPQTECGIDGRWALGCDLAKAVDWTVLVGIRTDVAPWAVGYFERFQKRPWPEVEVAIKHAQAQLNADVLLDTTGVGAVTFDHLDIPTWRVEGFDFTAKRKHELITNLAYCLEKKKLSIPYIKPLIDELYDYEWDDKELTTDCVMALALACWKANDEKPVGGVI